MNPEDLKKEIAKKIEEQNKATDTEGKSNPIISDQQSTTNKPIKLKILWYGVAPYIKSGYGVVAANCVDRLISKGYPTIIAAYYGIDSGGFLKLGNTYVVPVEKLPNDGFGFSSLLRHMDKFQMDIIVYMTDFWVARPLAEKTPRLYVYTPIDHENYSLEQQDLLRKFGGLAIPSMHGVKEVAKYGIKAHYLPHGVDLNVYKPVPEPDKVKCREYFKLKKDQFVVGIVAENNDTEPRKGWDAMFNAVKIFLDNNPDARKDFKLMCHTNPYNAKGYNLIGLSKNLKIEDVITWQDPYMKLLGMPPSLMMVLYNSFDVLFNLASREGFCLPMLEAQACGIPSISTKFSAMIERVNYGKCGWLVKPKGLRFSPINAQTSVPDEIGAAEALEEAYNNDKLRKMYSKKGLTYSKNFSWDIVVDKYFVPWLEDIESSLKAKPLEARKIAGNTQDNVVPTQQK